MSDPAHEPLTPGRFGVERRERPRQSLAGGRHALDRGKTGASSNSACFLKFRLVIP